jgi:hypothetical protein
MGITRTMRTGFGWVEIGGEIYENDVVIHVDGTITKREKKRSKEFKEEYGHTPLSHKELDILEDEDPEVVIVGTGQYGDLPITPKAKKILEDYRTEVLPTPQALERVMVEKGKFVAFIHVTC